MINNNINNQILISISQQNLTLLVGLLVNLLSFLIRLLFVFLVFSVLVYLIGLDYLYLNSNLYFYF